MTSTTKMTERVNVEKFSISFIRSYLNERAEKYPGIYSDYHRSITKALTFFSDFPNPGDVDHSLAHDVRRSFYPLFIDGNDPLSSDDVIDISIRMIEKIQMEDVSDIGNISGSQVKDFLFKLIRQNALDEVNKRYLRRLEEKGFI